MTLVLMIEFLFMVLFAGEPNRSPFTNARFEGRNCEKRLEGQQSVAGGRSSGLTSHNPVLAGIVALGATSAAVELAKKPNPGMRPVAVGGAY